MGSGGDWAGEEVGDSELGQDENGRDGEPGG